MQAFLERGQLPIELALDLTLADLPDHLGKLLLLPALFGRHVQFRRRGGFGGLVGAFRQRPSHRFRRLFSPPQIRPGPLQVRLQRDHLSPGHLLSLLGLPGLDRVVWLQRKHHAGPDGQPKHEDQKGFHRDSTIRRSGAR